MPRYSAFSYFGALAYSSKRPHGEAIYEALRDGMGDTYEASFTGREQSRLYGQAVALADAQYQLDRAGNNITPTRATEMLAKLESDYQIVPAPSSSLDQRRRTLSARWQVSQGARRGSVVAALSTLLGADFIDYITVSSGIAPQWPISPGSVGIFAAAGAAQKALSITPAISTIGTPLTVAYAPINGSPIPSSGEKYCVDPDPRRAIEQITVIAATASTLTAVFSCAHEAGTLAVRPYPIWESYQRYAVIVTSLSCAKNIVKRKQIHDLMARVARGVSQWAISINLGSFTCDDPVLGLTDCAPVS